MLILRTEQAAALSDPAAGEFACRLLAHVKAVLPGALAAISDDEARRIVRSGIERARLHGIGLEFDVLRFVDLVFILGEGFDTDAAYPWAAAILDRADLAPSAKVDRLTEESAALLRAATGRQA